MANKLITTALSAVVALGVAQQATAATMNMKTPKGMEKCYGIAKAGKNDCGSSSTSCAGESKIDGDKHAWLAVPKGTCNRIVGGSKKEG